MPDLFIVLISIGSDIIAVEAGTTRSVVLQGDNLETGAGRGAWLGGDHPSEPGDAPRPHVVVLRAHGHQVLLGQRHSRHRGPTYRISLIIKLLRIETSAVQCSYYEDP